MFDPHLGLQFLQASICFCLRPVLNFSSPLAFLLDGAPIARATFLSAANLVVSDEAKFLKCKFSQRLGINGPQSDLISSNRWDVSVLKNRIGLF